MVKYPMDWRDETFSCLRKIFSVSGKIFQKVAIPKKNKKKRYFHKFQKKNMKFFMKSGNTKKKKKKKRFFSKIKKKKIKFFLKKGKTKKKKKKRYFSFVFQKILKIFTSFFKNVSPDSIFKNVSPDESSSHPPPIFHHWWSNALCFSVITTDCFVLTVFFTIHDQM